MTTAKFKHRNFKVLEAIEKPDGTKELLLQGKQHAEYRATLAPKATHWRVGYLYKGIDQIMYKFPVETVSFQNV